MPEEVKYLPCPICKATDPRRLGDEMSGYKRTCDECCDISVREDLWNAVYICSNKGEIETLHKQNRTIDSQAVRIEELEKLVRDANDLLYDAVPEMVGGNQEWNDRSHKWNEKMERLLNSPNEGGCHVS